MGLEQQAGVWSLLAWSYDSLFIQQVQTQHLSLHTHLSSQVSHNHFLFVAMAAKSGFPLQSLRVHPYQNRKEKRAHIFRQEAHHYECFSIYSIYYYSLQQQMGPKIAAFY